MAIFPAYGLIEVSDAIGKQVWWQNGYVEDRHLPLSIPNFALYF